MIWRGIAFVRDLLGRLVAPGLVLTETPNELWEITETSHSVPFYVGAVGRTPEEALDNGVEHYVAAEAIRLGTIAKLFETKDMSVELHEGLAYGMGKDISESVLRVGKLTMLRQGGAFANNGEDWGVSVKGQSGLWHATVKQGATEVTVARMDVAEALREAVRTIGHERLAELVAA